jgi:signal transduction histidine kinase
LTERKRAEDEHQHAMLLKQIAEGKSAIENERENFRNLFRQTPEMVCILKGSDHVLEFVNEAHIKALGFDATGKSVREAQPESVEVHGILDEVYRTGKTTELHEIPVTVTNRLRYFNLTYAARRDQAGKINGIMILGIEVTDQVLARRAAQDAIKAREDVVAMVSHDLKNPLSAIALNVNSIGRALNKIPASAQFKEKLERIEQSTNRMQELIDKVLDITKIEAGTFKVELREESPEGILSEVFNLFLPLARKGDLTLLIDTEPQCCPKLRFDRTKIYQVLLNLIGNGVKFTPKGGKVSVGAKDGPNEFLFWVKDSGPGIRKEDQINIFSRFWQATETATKGVGLGLAIAKGIVEAHGGRIWVESEPGMGAKFLFAIPK